MTDYDYFHAKHVTGDDDFDSLHLKHIDPTVALGQLVAFVLDQPYSVDLVDDRLVYPKGGANDPDYEGPWISELPDSVRNRLAEVPAERVPELAERWAGIEEFDGLFPAEHLRTVITDLVALSAEALLAGEALYCRAGL
jgi:hypothetical protein